MEIIKNNWTVPLETSCPECKSVISITADDVKRTEDRDYILGRLLIRRYVICPVCKATLDFKFPSDDKDVIDETLKTIEQLAERDDSKKSEVRNETN